MTDLIWEWRYLPSGRVTHALHLVGAYGGRVAKCGTSPWDATDWRGTGTQREYETAAHLPKCAKCLTAVGGKP